MASFRSYDQDEAQNSSVTQADRCSCDDSARGMPVRASAIATLGVVAAVAWPAAAQAGPRFDYRQVFTTDRPGRSTGIDTQILYKHPDDPNRKPPAVRQEIFTFPIGTTFDETVVPNCTVSDEEMRLMPDSACPQETWLGSGHNNTSMAGFGDGREETPIV